MESNGERGKGEVSEIAKEQDSKNQELNPYAQGFHFSNFT